MSRPGDLAPAVLADVRRELTHGELVELVLDVMKWSYQKVSVALGTDSEVRQGELTDLAFDAAGNPVR